jgi:hypothetical protein
MAAAVFLGIAREHRQTTLPGRLGDGLERLGCGRVAVESAADHLPVDHAGVVGDAGEEDRQPVVEEPRFRGERLQTVATGFAVEGVDASSHAGPVILAAGGGAEQPRLEVADQRHSV